MSNDLRLNDYFARIGFRAAPAPDLPTLAAIHAAHVNTIPFEGLNPFLGRPVKLDLASVQEKLLDNRRGGYCFEQNALLQAVLGSIGYMASPLGARVRWNAPPDSPLGPRTHMLLKVELPQGPYLADVGFGACVLDAPLRFETGIEQRTAMGTYRLTEADGLYTLSAKQSAGWRVMYVFDLQPQIPADFELGNWYTSTSPHAPFSSTLIMERVAAEKRYKLINRRFAIEARDGEIISESTIATPNDLGRILDQTFGITAPVAVDEIFGRTGG
ncbi:MAG: N-hydroxyarylamine O-acetyltransferase [Betaproteobacteria bacterium]|nr:N-hydroxyarylamine O-acetyltransferase [Betaproteobacteria bacterium]